MKNTVKVIYNQAIHFVRIIIRGHLLDGNSEKKRKEALTHNDGTLLRPVHRFQV